jgi:hypothetical protein
MGLRRHSAYSWRAADTGQFNETFPVASQILENTAAAQKAAASFLGNKVRILRGLRRSVLMSSTFDGTVCVDVCWLAVAPPRRSSRHAPLWSPCPRLE